jgi:hypothetical protein
MERLLGNFCGGLVGARQERSQSSKCKVKSAEWKKGGLAARQGIHCRLQGPYAQIHRAESSSISSLFLRLYFELFTLKFFIETQ